MNRLLLISLILLGGCILMPKQEDKKLPALDSNDSIAVSNKLGKLRQLLLGPDSSQYQVAAAKLTITMIYTESDTSRIIHALRTDTAGYFAGYNKLLNLIVEDSSVRKFYTDILLLRKAYPALVSGKYTLFDASNPYSCGFTKSDSKDTMLIIYNLNEDNQGFKGHFPFQTMALLLSNYEDGPMPPIDTSIALRPFEIRISKL